MSLLLLFGGNGGAATTYALWNPDDKSADITLASGNTRATCTATYPAWRSVRSTLGFTTGDRYAEIAIQGAALESSPYVTACVADAAHSLENRSGTVGNNGWGIMTAGFSLSPGSAVNDLLPFNDVRIGVSMLRSTDTVKFYNVTSGTAVLIKSFDISSISGTALYLLTSITTQDGNTSASGQSFIFCDPADFVVNTVPDSITEYFSE